MKTEKYTPGKSKKAMYMTGMKKLIEIYSRAGADERDAKAKRIVYHDKYHTAQRAQVVVFDVEQIKVFWELIKRGKFLPSVDYRLPFPDTWIQFSENFSLSDDADTPLNPDMGNVALLLTQQESGFNRVIVIHEEFDDEAIAWNSENPSNMPTFNIFGPSPFLVGDQYRMLAAACIAFINCENIYLHKECVPEAINAKRERKGKSRLEPYYVCRIRGVQYDSAGNPTGEGAKHGIRYDVRGHFRRMTDGRTTWVRPHQRGLANELYVPKTYVVDKKVMA